MARQGTKTTGKTIRNPQGPLSLQDLLEKNVVRAAERRVSTGREDKPKPLQDTDGGAISIPLRDIRRNPQQPRTEFNEEEIRELAASLQRDGQLQPIVVRPVDGPIPYEIIMGERRFRAAQTAKLPSLRAVVRPADDHDVLRLALVENIQRVDLNAVDKGTALKRLKELNPGLVWKDIGNLLGLTEQTIHNLVGLLKLPPDIQREIRQGNLNEKHGRALRQLPEEQQKQLVREIRSQSMSGEQALERARDLKKGSSTDSGITLSRRSTPNPELLSTQSITTESPETVDPKAELRLAEQRISTAIEGINRLHRPQRYVHKELGPVIQRIEVLLQRIQIMADE
jgi:ParB/RepB/Spo0J family partition protein